MTEDDDAAPPAVPSDAADTAAARPDLPAAALRALAEAEARRRADPAVLPAVPEAGGRGGLDPVRYADWEIAGRAVDF